MNLKIDLNSLPAEGLHLVGRLDPSVFGLESDDELRAVSPLEYDLTVTRDEDDLIAVGRIAATFDLECGRCAERFQTRMELPRYVLDVPLENEGPIDLTSWLREDMLLALPTYPRCETGNVTPRRCPAEGRFDSATKNVAGGPQKGDAEVWKALDQLENLKRN